MGYTPTTWVNGETRINASNLNNLERQYQEAVADAASKYVPTGRTIATGTGLQGGGNLTANRTLSLTAQAVASLAAADTAVQPSGLTKAAVGLGNVDNTADSAKPVSTAQQSALNGKVATGRGVYASTGLKGGGTLAQDISFALSDASQASLAKADSASQPGHTHTASELTDASTVGKSVLTAADQATARNALAAPSWGTTITGTGGLTGGGNLTGSRTLDLSDASKASLALADGSVQQSTIGNGQVYGKNGSGTQTGVGFSQNSVAGTLAQRDGGGMLNVNYPPTANNHAAAKAYVDSLVSPLLPGAIDTGTGLDAAATPSSFATPGMFISQLAGTGWPTQYGTVLTVNLNINRAFQIITAKETNQVWTRTATGGTTWSPVLEQASKTYVDAGDAAQVSVVAAGSGQLYWRNSSGTPAGLSFGTAATNGYIVQRQTSGGIFVPQTPTNNTDAASKSYVDSYTPADLASGGRLGSLAKDVSSSDINSLVATGFFRGSSLTNGPGGNGWYYVVVQSHDTGNWIFQQATGYTDVGDQKTYQRQKRNGTWSSWTQIADKDGAVDVTARINANGRYTKPSGGIPDSDLASSFVKTVNGIKPDTSGNINVAGGGGGSGTVNSVNGKGADANGAVTLTPADVGAVPLAAAANGMVFTKDSGAASGISYSQTAAGSAIVQRTSAGQVTVPATPASTTDAASKSYVDAGDAAQVSVSAAANGTVYAKNGSGAVVGIGYGTSGTASNAIPQRQSNGQIAVPATPAAATDATSKQYTDQTFAQIGRAIATGTGLQGGGTLTADRTISLDAATQATVASASRFFGSSDLTGVSMFGVGNSWVASPTGGVTQFVNRAASALNAASYRSIATSGYRMQDSAVEALTGQQVRSKAWPQNMRGVVVVGDLLNNEVEADTTTNRNAALEGMRSLVALLRSSRRIEQDDSSFSFSSSPGWAQVNSTKAWASGRSASLANSTGAYVDFDLPAGVTTYFVGMGTDPASFAGANVEFRRGTSTTDVMATQAYDSKYLKTGYHSDGVGPVVTRLDYTQQMTNRVRAITTNANYFFVDGLLPQYPAGQGPIVFLVKPVPVLSSDYQKTALNTYLRTVPDTVAAEFGSDVVVVDPISGWNANTMLLDDQLHPNETGATYLATTLTNAIRAELVRRQSTALNTALGLI